MISLDGVMQAPGGSKEDAAEGFKYGGWAMSYNDEASDRFQQQEMSRQYDLILGRMTYDIWNQFWPKHADMAPYGPIFDKAIKYLVSHSVPESPWQKTVVIKDNIVEEIKKIKEEDGPDIQVWGSKSIVQILLKNNLVDELWLKIFPITLGHGKKLFEDGAMPRTWKLIKSDIAPNGVIYTRYAIGEEIKAE